MYFKKDDIDRIYKLYLGLCNFVNNKYKIVKNAKFDRHGYIDPQQVRQVSERLWENGELIAEYIKKNPDKLNLADLDALHKWKSNHLGPFTLMEYVEKDGVEYAVFCDGAYAYMVPGISNDISEVVNRTDLPTYVNTTLLPYKDRIIYETFIQSYPVKLGENILNRLDLEYKAIKANGNYVWTSREFIDALSNIDAQTEIINAIVDEDLFDSDTGEYINKKKSPEEIAQKHLDDLVKTTKRNSIKKMTATDLKTLLTGLTTKKVKEIASNLHINRVSKMKKPELADSIYDLMINPGNGDYYEDILYYFSDETHEFIEHLIKRGPLNIDYNDISNQTIYALSELGIAFLVDMGKGFSLVTSDEFIDKYDSYKKNRDIEKQARIESVRTYLIPAMNFYGYISVDRFYDLYCEYEDLDLDYMVFDDMVLGLVHSFDTGYDMIEGCILSPQILKSEYHIIERAVYEATVMPVVQFSSEKEFMKYTDPNYYVKGKEYDDIYAYLQTHLQNVGDKDIKYIIDTIYQAIKFNSDYGKFIEVLNEFDHDMDIDQLNEFSLLVMNFNNNTSSIYCGGWTPNEKRNINDNLRSALGEIYTPASDAETLGEVIEFPGSSDNQDQYHAMMDQATTEFDNIMSEVSLLMRKLRMYLALGIRLNEKNRDTLLEEVIVNIDLNTDIGDTIIRHGEDCLNEDIEEIKSEYDDDVFDNYNQMFLEEISIKGKPVSSLRDILDLRSKEDLENAIYNFADFEKAPKQLTKSELVDELYDRFSNIHVIKNLLLNQTTHQQTCLLAILANQDEVEPVFAKGVGFNVRDCNIVNLFFHKGKYSIVIPDEVKHALIKIFNDPEFIVALSLVSTFRDYADAALNLYGIFSLDELKEIVQQYEDASFPIDYVIDLFLDKLDYFDRLRYKGQYLVNPNIEGDHEIKKIIKSHSKTTQYRPSKEEFLKYKSSMYFEKTPAYDKLFSFVTGELKLSSGKKRTKMLAEAALDDMQSGILWDEAADFAVEALECRGFDLSTEKIIDKFLRLYLDFKNEVRSWICNGNTPNGINKAEDMDTLTQNMIESIDAKLGNEDISTLWNNTHDSIDSYFEKETPIVKAPKIGRNDPCPCGSGKKYKKCCMNKDQGDS